MKKEEMNIRKAIHWFVKLVNRLIGYRIWEKGKEPDVL